MKTLIKQFNVTLDLVKDVFNENFSINQNDLNNIQLNLNLLNDGIPIDLTGFIVRLAIKKPDNLTVIQDAEIVEIGKAQLLLNTQAFSENGDHIGEVYLYQNDQTHVLKSKFKYFVIESIMNDETIESANEWQSINQALVNYISREDVEVIVGSKIDEMETNGELSVLMEWADISNKPTTFDPAIHTHTIDDIIDLDLSIKADVIHSHIIEDVSGLQAELDGKVSSDSPNFTGSAKLNGTGAVMQFITPSMTNAMTFSFNGIDIDGTTVLQRGYLGIPSASTPTTIAIASTRGDLELRPKLGFFTNSTGPIKEVGTLLSEKYALKTQATDGTFTPTLVSQQYISDPIFKLSNWMKMGNTVFITGGISAPIDSSGVASEIEFTTPYPIQTNVTGIVTSDEPSGVVCYVLPGTTNTNNMKINISPVSDAKTYEINFSVSYQTD